MSSLMRRRDVFTKVRTTLKEFFLKSRKEHFIDEINNLLRNKFIDEIDVSTSLFLLQRVDVLLSTLIVKKQISLTLKKKNIRLNNIERNTTKIIIILIFYAVVTKTNAQREIDVTTTTIIASYNNINQQRQLKKTKREKTLIIKIKKQSEKNNLRMLFVKKLIKRLQRIEKIKKNVMTTKRFFNENVKLITRSKKIKNRLIINNSLMKNVASSTYAMSRIFEILIHEMRMIDVQMSNQQKIIRRIERQNEILHSSLRIARIIWSKNVINEKKNLSSLIVKIYSAEQINRLIKNDFLHEYSQISCELFVNNCRIKQCFNCQRYDHIDKICRHERRCSVCIESHNDSTCKISIDKRKCVNCENNHSIWSFQCKIKIIEKNKISNIWRTKSILHSINLKDIQQTTFKEFDVSVQQTFSRKKITSSTSFFCFSIKEVLIQKKTTILKNIMHLKTKNYSMNEIINKRTLSQNFERSMSSSSRQRSVSVMQMFSSQTNNAFDVLKNRLNTRTFQKLTQNTQTQTSIQSQTVFKSRKRSFNNKKTIESRQNDDELWRHDSFLQYYNTMWKMKKKNTMMSFLIDFRIKKYDLLTIQKS
jgi:hypothetical protein